MIKIKLKTLSTDFISNALKFKIDRMRYVSEFYEVVDDSIFINEKTHVEKVSNHKVQRLKVCNHSKFYNQGELKHSMLTFHNEKG